MKKKLRIGTAVLLTTVLLTIYVLIQRYLNISVWKPLLCFGILLGGLGAAGYYLPRFLPGQWREALSRFLDIYHRAEESVYFHFSERVFFLLLWLLLFLAFLPAWFALFPGTFGYDAPIQAAAYFGQSGVELTAHHPLAHTFLMGVFFSIGEKLFHSYTVGFALYIVLQGLAVTGSIAYSLLACRRHRVPLVWIVIGAAWAGINPFLWIITFNSTKDVLFGAFLLCLTVALWDGLECSALSRAHYVRLTVFGILMCLFRNQGLYIVLALLFFCLILRAGKKGLCISLLLVCLISQGFFTLSSAVFNIPRGDTREMLCVPIQQMGRVASMYVSGEGAGVDITPEQYEITAELIAPEGIVSYLPNSADNVKSYFRTELLTQDFGKYFSNYIAMGMQNPREYLMAWVELIAPYWNMNCNANKVIAFEATFPSLNSWEIHRRSDNVLADRIYAYLYRAVTISKTGILQRPEVCLWILALLPGLALATKRKKMFLSILPLGLYLGTTILGPVALLRYLFPLTMATPLLLGMLFQRRGDHGQDFLKDAR